MQYSSCFVLPSVFQLHFQSLVDSCFSLLSLLALHNFSVTDAMLYSVLLLFPLFSCVFFPTWQPAFCPLSPLLALLIICIIFSYKSNNLACFQFSFMYFALILSSSFIVCLFLSFFPSLWTKWLAFNLNTKSLWGGGEFVGLFVSLQYCLSFSSCFCLSSSLFLTRNVVYFTFWENAVQRA